MTTNVTELETRLADPGGAVLKASLLEHAKELEQSWRARMAAGLPRGAFAQWQAAADAAAAAVEILQDWPANPLPPGEAPTHPPSPFRLPRSQS
ncbi:hypothetical protein [Alcaligenes sp. WGS1538]|uniref:hypothetical protein n=1 Tax=Alcaligenes sp. WGS1538 TaxID=3366811 RepID=UPI00372D4759